MKPGTPDYTLVTVTPPEDRFAFRVEIPANWGQLAVPQEAVDFSNVGAFDPIAVFAAKYGAVLLTFSARPGLGEGAVADWFRRVCEADKIEIGRIGPAQAGSIPTVGALGTQQSEAGPMTLRIMMFEQEGWLHALMAMAPAAIWDSVTPTFDRMFASFTMTHPTAATVPLWPPGSEPKGAVVPARGEDLSRAREAADRFLQAGQRGDEATAKALLITHEGESLDFKSMHGAALGYELGQAQADGELVVVEAKLRATPPGESQAQEQSLPLVLRQVDGTWKVDMGASINRMLGVNVEEAMTQMAEGLGKAMAKGVEAIAEGLAALSSPGGGTESFEDAADHVRQTVLPQETANMSQTLGKQLDVSVEWCSLGESIDAAHRMGPLVLEPLGEAVRKMTEYVEEREKLQRVLERVLIRHVGRPQERMCRLDGGLLELAVCLVDSPGPEEPAGFFTVYEISEVLRQAVQ